MLQPTYGLRSLWISYVFISLCMYLHLEYSWRVRMMQVTVKCTRKSPMSEWHSVNLKGYVMGGGSHT